MTLHVPAETTAAPVIESTFPSVPMTPLRPAAARTPARDDNPGVLRTLAMFLFAR